MPPIAACADSSLIVVTKTIVGSPFTGGGGQSATLQSGDPVTFAIAVKNVGGEAIVVDISDVFNPVFTGMDGEDPTEVPSWTRTGPTGTVTTGTGDITESAVSIGAGLQITYLVEAVYSPAACTSVTVNVVTVTLPGDNCCHEDEVYAWAKVKNGTAGAPKAKLDATEGFTAMEALTYLLEGASLPAKVAIAEFVNNCGTFATLIGEGGGVADGPAVAILDAFGVPTGLFGETSIGV